MFTKTIALDASKKCFRFSCGVKEVSFSPVVYLTEDRRVLSVGEAPTERTPALVARIFEDDFDDAFAVLEAIFRYGTQLVSPGFSLLRLHYRISIASDIRHDLKGFASPLFQQAAIHAGASKVEVVMKTDPNQPASGQRR